MSFKVKQIICCSCLVFFTGPPHKNSFSDKEQRKKKILKLMKSNICPNYYYLIRFNFLSYLYQQFLFLQSLITVKVIYSHMRLKNAPS